MFSASFYCYVMAYKMFSEEKMSYAGQETNKVLAFYSNTSYDFENKKIAKVHCQLKCSLKKIQIRKGLCLPNASEF